MTISSDVCGRFFNVCSDGTAAIVNLPRHSTRHVAPADLSDFSYSQHQLQSTATSVCPACATPARRGLWAEDEHQRFLWAMETFPNGPWKQIAAVVQTRSVRQTMAHAQRYADKIKRHRRGLRRGKTADIAAVHSVPSVFEPLDAWESDTAALLEVAFMAVV